MSVNKFVHCHICPLKDCCTVGKPDASWRRFNQGEMRNDRIVETRMNDLAEVQKASQLCPIKRSIAYCDTKMSVDLIRQVKKGRA